MKSAMMTLFAALSLLTVAATANAQAALGTWTKTGGAMTEAQTEFVAGYNFVHATNCLAASDGTTTLVCLIPREGENICTANAVVQTTMLTACQTGNFLAFYLPNPATGVFTQVVTFTTK